MSLRTGIEILRPVNCAMIGFAVIVGEFVSRPPGIPLLQTALGFMTGFFLCAYSMVVNDVYDVEVDKVNRPERPIPSGRITEQGASRLSIVALLLGIASSVLGLNPVAVGIALLYALVSWLYNSRAKKAGFSGNVMVASSLAIPFIYGGVISGGSVFNSLLLMMAFTSFFSGVGREVVKAMADIEGDAKRGISSVAWRRGSKTAAAVGAAFFLLAVLTSWLPLVLGLANGIYTFGVIVPDLVFVYLAASILRDWQPKNAHRVKNTALLGMLAGLFVFIGGAV
ncbi:MAG: geranylgeranylglycerol-phosphate geranylgeranyltransferase [Nitrososphaerales archaeon]|nr:geranylgeranylglycerol-phosphate geranylgeranyltransferase [Nitrososphaerales archaeon]